MNFKCDRCGDECNLDGLGIFTYDVPGEVLAIPFPAWCHECDDVTKVEYVPSEAAIIEEARAWKKRDRKWNYQIQWGPKNPNKAENDEQEAAALAYYDDVLAWRRQRKSLGRCLRCGSLKVSRQASDRIASVPDHPGCGGTLVCHFKIDGGIRTCRFVLLSVEGLPISERMGIS
jgi:hypothetical protein